MKCHRDCRRLKDLAGDFLIGLAVSLAILVIAVGDTRSAHSAPAFSANSAPSLPLRQSTPSSATRGTLFLKHQGADENVSLVHAERLGTDVDITVNGPIARATVLQRFRNTTGEPADAIYAFPLPEQAVVETLNVKFGGRVIEGALSPRAEVDQLYDAARQAGRDAPPRTIGDRNVFAAGLADVEPGDEIVVRFVYQQTLASHSQSYSLRFPLAAHSHHMSGRKLHRATWRDGENDEEPAAPVSIQVRLNSGFDLGDVVSPTHRIAVRRPDKETALLALTHTNVSANRDFELSWRYGLGTQPLVTGFSETRGEASYVLAMIAPPKDLAKHTAPPRELTLVLDTSASMAGTSLSQARESIRLALERLRPADRFNIIVFNTSPDRLFDKPAAATRKNIEGASEFLYGLQAKGGTRPLSTLKAALGDRAPDTSGTKPLRQIVFVTDGAFPGGAEFLAHLAAATGDTRLFMIGIGNDHDTSLMQRAAEIGRGESISIPSKFQVLSTMNHLFRRLEQPVITDLKAEWAAGLRTDVSPNPLPDLYEGQPLLIAARLSALKGGLTLTGKIGGKPWSEKLTLSNARVVPGIGQLWARRKIASLETRVYSGQTEKDVASAIESVALEHGLPSRTTTLVPLERTGTQHRDQPLASEELALDIPVGWIYQREFSQAQLDRSGAFGRTESLSDIRIAPLSSLTRAGIHSIRSGLKEVAGTKVAVTPAGLAPAVTPVGSTAASGSSWVLVVMAFIFSAMSALTLGLWRHLRHAVTPHRIGRR